MSMIHGQRAAGGRRGVAEGSEYSNGGGGGDDLRSERSYRSPHRSSRRPGASQRSGRGEEDDDARSEASGASGRSTIYSQRSGRGDEEAWGDDARSEVSERSTLYSHRSSTHSRPGHSQRSGRGDEEAWGDDARSERSYRSERDSVYSHRSTHSKAPSDYAYGTDYDSRSEASSTEYSRDMDDVASQVSRRSDYSRRPHRRGRGGEGEDARSEVSYGSERDYVYSHRSTHSRPGHSQRSGRGEEDDDSRSEASGASGRSTIYSHRSHGSGRSVRGGARDDTDSDVASEYSGSDAASQFSGSARSSLSFRTDSQRSRATSRAGSVRLDPGGTPQVVPRQVWGEDTPQPVALPRELGAGVPSPPADPEAPAPKAALAFAAKSFAFPSPKDLIARKAAGAGKPGAKEEENLPPADRRSSELGDDYRVPEKRDDDERLSEAGDDENLDLDAFIAESAYSGGPKAASPLHDPAWPPPKEPEEEAGDIGGKKKKAVVKTIFIRTRSFGASKCYVYGPSKKTAKGFILCVPGVSKAQTTTWHQVATTLAEDGWRVYCPDLYANVATRSHDLQKGATFIYEALQALKAPEWRGTFKPATIAQAKIAAAKRSMASGEKIFTHWLEGVGRDSSVYSLGGPGMKPPPAPPGMEPIREGDEEAIAGGSKEDMLLRSAKRDLARVAGSRESGASRGGSKEGGVGGGKGEEGGKEIGNAGDGAPVVAPEVAAGKKLTMKKMWGKAIVSAERGDLEEEEEREQLLVLCGRGWGAAAVAYFVARFENTSDRIILQAPATKDREVVKDVPDDLDVLITWNEDDAVHPFSDITLWEEELRARMDFYPFEEGGDADPTPEFGEICIHFLNDTLGVYDEMVAEREMALQREERLSDGGDNEDEDNGTGSHREGGARYEPGGSAYTGTGSQLPTSHYAEDYSPALYMPTHAHIGPTDWASDDGGSERGTQYSNPRQHMSAARGGDSSHSGGDEDTESEFGGSRASEYNPSVSGESAALVSPFGMAGRVHAATGPATRRALLLREARRQTTPSAPSEVGTSYSGLSRATDFTVESGGWRAPPRKARPSWGSGASSVPDSESDFDVRSERSERQGRHVSMVRENPLYKNGWESSASSVSGASDFQYPTVERGVSKYAFRSADHASPSDTEIDVSMRSGSSRRGAKPDSFGRASTLSGASALPRPGDSRDSYRSGHSNASSGRRSIGRANPDSFGRASTLSGASAVPRPGDSRDSYRSGHSDASGDSRDSYHSQTDRSRHSSRPGDSRASFASSAWGTPVPASRPPPSSSAGNSDYRHTGRGNTPGSDFPSNRKIRHKPPVAAARQAPSAGKYVPERNRSDSENSRG